MKTTMISRRREVLTLDIEGADWPQWLTDLVHEAVRR